MTDNGVDTGSPVKKSLTDTLTTSSRPARLRSRLGPVAAAGRWKIEAAIALASMGYGAFAWWIYPWRPGVYQAAGYVSWFDQSSYIAQTALLAKFSLPDPLSYQYGLGYPIIGVPFYWLGLTADPLLIPDLILLATAMVLSFRLALRLTGSRAIAYVLVLVLLCGSPLIVLSIVPWSTSVTLVCLTGALLVAARPFTLTGALWMGFFAGWSFSARYVDVLVILFMAFFYVGRQRGGVLVKAIGSFTATAGPQVLLVAISQAIVFGSPLITPYTSHVDKVTGSSDQSLAHYRWQSIPRHFWETFVSGWDSLESTRSDHDPLLFITPLLVLMPVGVWLVLRKANSIRGLHVAAISGTLVQGAIYLSFRAGGGGNLHFNNARYWIASYPYWLILSLIGVAWVARGLRDRRGTKGSANEGPKQSGP